MFCRVLFSFRSQARCPVLVFPFLHYLAWMFGDRGQKEGRLHKSHSHVPVVSLGAVIFREAEFRKPIAKVNVCFTGYFVEP